MKHRTGTSDVIGRNFERTQRFELNDTSILMALDLLRSRFENAPMEQRPAMDEGKLRKTASIQLSRAALALQGETEGIQSGLWPTVRNTRFFADRLQRIKVDFHHWEIPNDGAFVSGAAARVENDDKAEQGDIDLAQTEVFIRSISAFKEITDETLADFGPGGKNQSGAGIQGMIGKSLLQAVLMEIDAQIVAGDGIAPNILGIREWPNLASQSKASDTTLVAAAKAAEDVYAAGYSPDLILMHPTDWREAVTTAAVDPFAVAGKLFGIDVFVSEASPVGFPMVLDTSAVYFLERTPINLMMTKTNEDRFLMNITTLRAEQRVAVAVTDTAAACKVVT